MPFKETPPFYHVWRSMKDRCLNPKNRQWNDYGGRGIKICDRWLNDYHAFAADMGERPEGHTLDRIDNNGDYTPSNCRWASRREQQRNRRKAVFVEVGGNLYRAVELAEKAGVKTDTIVSRAQRGLPMDAVLSSEKLHRTHGLALGGAANGRRQRAKTHCPKGHPYTPENIRASKSGHRSCKTCHREREARRRERAS